MQKNFEKVAEVSYLAADNYERYRAIMNFFYKQHRQMNDLLYRKDILEYMHSLYAQNEYAEKELEQDLHALTSWGNIVPRQEMSEPKSIQEYKNKHFRYQITETSIALEEMMDKLENSSGKSRGSLDKNTFERLLNSLTLLQSENDSVKLLNTWDDVQTHFTNIKNNTSDYIGYLHSDQAEAVMQTEAFLVFKDKFIFYLRDFIVTMQNTADRIQKEITNVSEDRLETIFQLVVDKEKKIPSTALNGFDEKGLRIEFFGIWQSIRAWFISDDNKTSEYSSLIKQTTYAISKMTRMIQRFSDRRQQYQSRKKDYIKLAKWFYQCEELDEVHRLSAIMFGAAHTKHFYADPLETSNKHSDLWEVAPSHHQTEPRIRAYRTRTKAASFQRKSTAKRELLEGILEERAVLENQMKGLIQDQKIDLGIHQTVPIAIRKVFLRWLSLTYQQEKRAISTEFGFQVKTIIYPERRIKLESEDGILTMPHVVFEIQQ
ncbi:TIGR02677 family protein [Ornithinibacillus gellani]|uniref:TIGR02677 family protein n=1 Tax=Ornithinibacillus gellani TaxID=2293253 RepID=UPI000F463B6A|nr:TIGR02677 family protein [Ornithinibacillus gellani]TQS75901.1 TIGR02677 family protein [Ornithinibacillus gellani]